LDIEVLPILGYAWAAYNQNIYPNQVKKDWSLLSYSAKWVGSDTIISRVLTPNEAVQRNDLALAKDLWALLDEAFIVITHNGRRFDIRKINTRFWKHRLHKPRSYRVIDTLVAARSVFGLTYNGMNEIAKFKEADEKLHTDFKLWARCDEGNEQALNEMLEYNEQDVNIQEQIYMEMREWIPDHPNLGIYQNLKNVCPICLGTDYSTVGIFVTNKSRFPEHRCKNCNSIFHDSKPIKEKK
jgi:hypothetical protein